LRRKRVPQNRFILNLAADAYPIRRCLAISPEVRFLRIFSVLSADTKIVGKDSFKRKERIGIHSLSKHQRPIRPAIKSPHVGKEPDMNRHSMLLGLRLGLLVALLSFSFSSPAFAFFPPDNINIVVPLPPPVVPNVPPPGPCCGCDCPPPPGPHVQTTPEPMTIITSLVGLSMLGGLGLRKRLLGK
jgi:hypothetical protein